MIGLGEKIFGYSSLEQFADNTPVIAVTPNNLHIGFSKGKNELTDVITIPNLLDNGSNSNLPYTIQSETYLALETEFTANGLNNISLSILKDYIVAQGKINTAHIINLLKQTSNTIIEDDVELGIQINILINKLIQHEFES